MNSNILIDPEESVGVGKVESAMLALSQNFGERESLRDTTKFASPSFREVNHAVF